jgi:mono/diheme cytochrome c family protein
MGFTGNGADIGSQTRHGLMHARDFSRCTGAVMWRLFRYSVKIASSCCVAILAGGSAVGQPLIGREAPNGDLFVVDSRSDAVHVLRAHLGRPAPLGGTVFARGLTQPLGIAFYPLGSHPRWIYIATSDGVVRFRYRNGELRASARPERITAGIPIIHRYTRDVALSPDGNPLYFSLGSARTPTVAGDPGTCEGMTVEPATGELSCIDEHEGADDTRPQSARLQVAVYEGDNTSSPAAEGLKLYIANCAACHQANGEGLPGVFPPLKGSGVVNKDDASKHIQVVLNGMQGGRAGGVVYAAHMPPFAGALRDTSIADIINYERSSWGNHGKPVTAAQVSAERARPK